MVRLLPTGSDWPRSVTPWRGLSRRSASPRRPDLANPTCPSMGSPSGRQGVRRSAWAWISGPTLSHARIGPARPDFPTGRTESGISGFHRTLSPGHGKIGVIPMPIDRRLPNREGPKREVRLMNMRRSPPSPRGEPIPAIPIVGGHKGREG